MWYAVFAFWACLLLVFVAAWRWGGSAERTVATMYLLAALLTLAARFPGTSRFTTLQVVPAAIDVALLIGLVIVAVRVDRWWPIWSAALQLTTVLGHIAMMQGAGTKPFAYFMTVVSSAFPSLILLAVGILNHRRRMKIVSVRS